jgi:uncharacterized membrane protein
MKNRNKQILKIYILYLTVVHLYTLRLCAVSYQYSRTKRTEIRPDSLDNSYYSIHFPYQI